MFVCVSVFRVTFLKGQIMSTTQFTKKSPLTSVPQLPLPGWYDRSLCVNPWFQPNADVIQAEAYRMAGKYGVRKTGKDSPRVFRLHVDEQTDFLSPFTTVDVKTGCVTRVLPHVFRDTLDVPDWWKEGGKNPRNRVVWTDDPEAGNCFQSLSVMGGHLSVPNAWSGTIRSVEWDLRNAAAITGDGYTIDFHPLTARFDMHYWQLRANNPFGLPAGAHPHLFIDGADKPFPVVLPSSCWHPQHNPDGWYQPITRSQEFLDETWDYVNKLGFVVLWTKHCHRFTYGSTLDPLVMAAMYHRNFLRGTIETEPMFFPKGMSWRTEFYGVFGPEYEIPTDPNAQATFSILQLFEGFPELGIPPFDLVVTTGQARTHCVLRSMQQAVEKCIASGRKDLLERMVYLWDTSCDIPGFEKNARTAEAEMRKMGVRFETTESFSLCG